MKKNICSTFFCFCLFSIFNTDVLAEPKIADVSEVALVSEMQTAPHKGQTTWIGLHIKLKPGWHTYWRYAGDSGLPTTIKWATTSNAEVGAIQWPIPNRIKLGPIVNYGYKNETLLLMPLTAVDKGEITLSGQINWLVCREICIPQRTELSLKLPPADEAQPSNMATVFNKYRSRLPKAIPWEATATHFSNQVNLNIAMAQKELKNIEKIHFYPSLDGLIENIEPQKLTKTKNGVKISMTAGYAVEEGLKTLGGLIIITTRNNGILDEQAFRMEPIPLMIN